ncbi:MAG: TRM11 family methyltransferase [Clostridiaceae bacterium]
MGVNSYSFIKEEYNEFKITKEQFPEDFMNFKDISWVSQVTPFIKEFSKDGELILEPFAGMGTTIIAAAALGRKSIGIELEKQRFKSLQKRVDFYKDKYKYNPQLVNGDALTFNYPKDVDLVVTNFPYYNGNIESTENGNFYNIKSYEKYLSFIEEAVKKSMKSLKKDGYMVAFSENIRDLNGNMIPQAYDVCNILRKYFHLKEERIILYPKDSTLEDDITITNRAHEYVFICKKKGPEINYSEYNKVLKAIGKHSKYLVIGTYGVFNICRAVLDNYPLDCDILVEDDLDSIKNIITELKVNGYKIYSWQEELNEDFDYSKLQGRYYLRAIKLIDEVEYKVDITYQCEYLDFNESYNNRVVKKDISFANLEDIIKLMKVRGNDKDKALVCRISKLRR